MPKIIPQNQTLSIHFLYIVKNLYSICTVEIKAKQGIMLSFKSEKPKPQTLLERTDLETSYEDAPTTCICGHQDLIILRNNTQGYYLKCKNCGNQINEGAEKYVDWWLDKVRNKQTQQLSTLN